MTRLATINGVEVRVYRDHNPPHFHLIDVGGEVQVSLITMMVMEGEMHPKKLRRAMEWAEANRPALIAEWNALNPDKAM